MAFARPVAQAADENVAVAAREAKVVGNAKGLQAQGNNRRALGDIGNLVAPFNARCNVGKENAMAKKAAPAQVHPVARAPGVLTRRQAAAAQAQQQEAGAAAVVVTEVAVKAEVPAVPAVGAWGATKRRSGLVLKDGNVQAEPAAVAVAERKAGKSMSSLLQDRSEAAVARAKPAEPASPMPDIDSKDKEDPLAATDYVADIYGYYRRVEPLYRVSPDYMSRQVDINDKMRAILVDWLVEVHLKFKLMPETLYLTTNLIDRFLEARPVTRKNLQLVGVTAMLIASKYEEIWAPEVRDFVYISDKAYTRDQILGMEKLMLNTLKFKLTIPTPFNFLARCLKASNITSSRTEDKELVLYATYLVELSLQEYNMLKYSYSMISTTAVYAAHKALGRTPAYPLALQKHSGFTEAALRNCAISLALLHRKAPNGSLVAVYKKYCNAKYGEIAKRPGPVGILESE